MNIIEAIKSGRPFRSGRGAVWKTMAQDGSLHWEDRPNQVGGKMHPTKSDLLRDDWEVREPEVTITRSKLDEVLLHVVDYFNLHTPDEYGKPFGATDATRKRVADEIARELGLTEETEADQ